MKKKKKKKKKNHQVVRPPRGFDCRSPNPRGWPHGSSLLNLMKMESFDGLTGRVEFDPEGRRSRFALRVGRVRRSGLQSAGEWNARGERAFFFYYYDLKPLSPASWSRNWPLCQVRVARSDRPGVSPNASAEKCSAPKKKKLVFFCLPQILFP